MYNFDVPGTVRAASEYVAHDEDSPVLDTTDLVSMPVSVVVEAYVTPQRRSMRVAAKANVVSRSMTRQLISLSTGPGSVTRQLISLSMGPGSMNR